MKNFSLFGCALLISLGACTKKSQSSEANQAKEAQPSTAGNQDLINLFAGMAHVECVTQGADIRAVNDKKVSISVANYRSENTNTQLDGTIIRFIPERGGDFLTLQKAPYGDAPQPTGRGRVYTSPTAKSYVNSAEVGSPTEDSFSGDLLGMSMIPKWPEYGPDLPGVWSLSYTKKSTEPISSSKSGYELSDAKVTIRFADGKLWDGQRVTCKYIPKP